MRIPVRTEHGWQIDAILDTTYVATKDGEAVTLEANTLEQMELLIALREGLVKHEDEPRATISMPDSFRILLDKHEQREYEKAIHRAYIEHDEAYDNWDDAIEEGNIDEAVSIIEKFAWEHPERSE